MVTPWWTSYFSLRPRRIAIVSSTEGSSTSTFWKRRSRAASFSRYLRYSSSVVAPTQCSSPRASAGLSILPASMAPSALPAPTMVCSSSMKRMTWPSCLARSRSTPFRRSSNSPRNFAPAISEPMSSARMRLFFRPSGTSPLTIRCASPSTIAVLPTPGSPISTGLFLVRRCSTWMVRRISSSRPITGSSFPAPARPVRSMVYFSSAWRPSSALASATFSPPRTSSMAFSTAPRTRPDSLNSRASAILERRQHEELARDELVAALLRELVGDVQHPVQVVGDVYLAGGALDLGQSVEERQQPRAQLVDVGPRLHEQRAHRAARAIEHRQQDMRGLDELMIAAERERLRVGQRLLKAAGQSVHAHESSTLVATLGRTAGLWGQTAVPSRGCGAEDAHTLARGLARKAPQLSRGAVPEVE